MAWTPGLHPYFFYPYHRESGPRFNISSERRCFLTVFSFSSEVELRPYTPAACSVMILWAEYKVEVAVVLVALPVAVRVLPQLLPRSSMSMIHTCSEAPFVQPPLMDAASELRVYLVVKHTGEKRCLLCI